MINQTAGAANLSRNLISLRKRNRYSLEQLAERIGVTRQAVAKWEAGESLPDIGRLDLLAKLYGVSLDALVNYDEVAEGISVPPLNKHVFGTVQVGERGQIVIPKKARDIFNLKSGDLLVVLGDTDPSTSGIALVRADAFSIRAAQVLDGMLGKEVLADERTEGS